MVRLSLLTVLFCLCLVWHAGDGPSGETTSEPASAAGLVVLHPWHGWPHRGRTGTRILAGLLWGGSRWGRTAVDQLLNASLFEQFGSLTKSLTKYFSGCRTSPHRKSQLWTFSASPLSPLWTLIVVLTACIVTLHWLWLTLNWWNSTFRNIFTEKNSDVFNAYFTRCVYGLTTSLP